MGAPHYIHCVYIVGTFPTRRSGCDVLVTYNPYVQHTLVGVLGSKASPVSEEDIFKRATRRHSLKKAIQRDHAYLLQQVLYSVTSR